VFLTAVGYNSQFVTVRRVDLLLVEEGSTINNYNVFTALYGCNYVRLEGQRVGIGLGDLIESADVDNCSALPFP